MTEEEIWRRWKASARSDSNALTPAEYRIINEMELEIEFEREGYQPAPPPPPKPVLRYADGDLRKLHEQADDLLRQGRAVAAADLYEQALLLFEASPQPDETLKVRLLSGLGQAQNQKGSREEAEASLNRALELARREQVPGLEQEVRYGLGQVYLKQNRAGLAADNLKDALALSRRQQDRAGEARVLRELGTAYIELSKLNQAVACLVAARKAFNNLELFPDYEERKQAERTISDQLQAARKKAEQVNYRNGTQQYQQWLQEAEAGNLLPE
jgi:tetratricopeptide (TPR) repeat protein